MALALMSLRPKDGPAKPRSEGQRPLILGLVHIPQWYVSIPFPDWF
ncbi:MAG: hypothetical protein JWL77_6310 [Chthonomonadaceae bacterium]|nr:hypothetical protein [Chthonomonadaceae bacterium]